MNDDPLRGYFQFVLMLGGIIYFFTRIVAPEYELYVRWPLLLVGGFYVLYKGSKMENPLSRKFFFIGAFISLIIWLGFNNLLEAGECTLKRSCPEGMFCATDHLCHSFPQYSNKITQVITSINIDFTFGGLLIGLSLIISAIILRKTTFYPKVSKSFSQAIKLLKLFLKNPKQKLKK